MAIEPTDMHVFETPAELRAWLEANHETATELWIARYKKGTGKPSVTWPEIVGQVLCFGWIDGVGKRIDDEVYAQRVTPRRKGSIWSAVNIAKVAELDAAGLMTPAGRAAFDARTDGRSGIYAHEQDEPATFTPEQEAELRADANAWAFWEGQPPSYRKAAVHWVVSAKKEQTRASRLATLVADSAAGERVKPLRRP
jgi:uncharacterized protein YdeI (YjbR/CyaY-like superfamily)